MANKIEIVSTSKAPKAVGPYSQATRAGGFIFCAGQGAFDPATGQLVPGGIKEQTMALSPASTMAWRFRSTWRVKVTVFLADWKYFKEMNEAYAEPTLFTPLGLSRGWAACQQVEGGGRASVRCAHE